MQPPTHFTKRFIPGNVTLNPALNRNKCDGMRWTERLSPFNDLSNIETIRSSVGSHLTPDKFSLSRLLKTSFAQSSSSIHAQAILN
ncbi:MAG: hypothetical protein DMG61_07920 [Acidobacteria bacterium]|nr:MAG: hypothetical protein DMG60_21680 [Acidobacteriota bacterium]PYY15109.1 MAG: hypothetical protein DMG61_07920 [Acidobacteriota bacterium]